MTGADPLLWAGLFYVCHVPLGVAAWRAAGRLIEARRDSTGPRLLLAGQIYFAVTVGVTLALGAPGCLTVMPLLIATLAVSIAMIAALGSVPGHQVTVGRPPARVAVGLIAALVTAVVLGAVAAPHFDYDVQTYHLWFPARWIQDARISIIPTWFSDPAPAYAPSATEVYYAALMLPLGNDAVARFGQMPFYLLLLTAVAVLAAELRLRPAARAAAIAGVAMVPGLAWQARTAMVDIALAAHLVACVAFALRVRRRTTSDAAVGLSLSIGLLLGTKFLALSYLAALTPLLLWAVWSARRRRIRRMGEPGSPMALQKQTAVISEGRRRGLIFASLVFAVWIGGYWYARNWIVVGNPLYPLAVRAGGITLFDGAFGRAQMVNSPFNLHRLGGTGAARLIQDTFDLPAWFAVDHRLSPSASLADTPAAFVFLVGCVFAAGLSIRHRRGAPELGLVFLTASLMIGVLWWWVPFQYGRFLWAAVALVWVVLLSTLTRGSARMGVAAAWVALAVWIAVQARQIETLVNIGAIGGCLSVVVGGLAVWRQAGSSWSRRVTRLVALLCPLALTLHALNQADTTRQADERLSRWAGFSGVWSYLETHVKNATIAYVGHNLPYFLLGPDLSNRVVYLPPRAGAADRYDLFARDPAALALGEPNISDAAPDRVILDGDAWLNRLRSAGVRWVFVSALLPGSLPAYRHGVDGFTIERTWLDQLARSPGPDGRPLATVKVFPPGRVRLYELDPTISAGAWPTLGMIVADETDALDRAAKDGTPPGAPIRFYPHAAQAIWDARRVPLR